MGHETCTNCDVRILRYHLSAWIMRLVEGRDFKLIELCRQTELLGFKNISVAVNVNFHSLPAIKRKKKSYFGTQW